MENKEEVIESYRKNSVSLEIYLSDLLSIIREHDGENSLEGNSFYYHLSSNRFSELFPKQVNLFWAGQQAQTKICEIGFNAGHSALLMLLGKRDSPFEFTVFDIGEHMYVRPCMQYISKIFPKTSFAYYEGDSTKILPAIIQSKPEMCESYDVVHVDGGHQEEIVVSDLFHAAKLLRKGGYLIVDDTNISYIDALVNKYISTGYFQEVDSLRTVGYQHRILQRVQ
jgi:hypothetical protein